MPTTASAHKGHTKRSSGKHQGRRGTRAKKSIYAELASVVAERAPEYRHHLAQAAPGARPLLKWAGGKRQLLPALVQLLPASIGSYFEPFAGGAALFFHLRQQGEIATGTLGDMNGELVTCYESIRDDVEGVVRLLRRHETAYAKAAEAHYLEVRRSSPTGKLDRAARLIFLNRTCYNGLWRVNSKGEFNVPMGRYKNPAICNQPLLRAAANALKGTVIKHEDFESLCARAGEGDFVYFDPPYVPLTKTASFTAYTKDSFSLSDQRRLAKLFKTLRDRGCNVMLSNSGTDVVRELYEGIARQIVRVPVRRAISSQANTRGVVHEYVVLSYEPTAQLLPLG